MLFSVPKFPLLIIDVLVSGKISVNAVTSTAYFISISANILLSSVWKISVCLSLVSFGVSF